MFTNRVMDRTGEPSNTWILLMKYVCRVLNYTYCRIIDTIPIHKLNGSTPDISVFLIFHFWEPIYYIVNDSDFPSQSKEEKCNIVGIEENVGNSFTYKVLTSDTKRIICRYNIRSIDDNDRNKCSDKHHDNNDDSRDEKINTVFDNNHSPDFFMSVPDPYIIDDDNGNDYNQPMTDIKQKN